MDTHGDMVSSAENGPLNGVSAAGSSHNRTGTYQRLFKPTMDRTLGGVFLVLTLPVLAISALVVRFKVGSPILYKQQRVGKDGSEFALYKLRTMTPDRRIGCDGFEGVDRRETHKSPGDPRVLPAAKKLRSWRLDELPQFWNVVTGDMSLVGPRPEMPAIVAEYEPWQHARHLVKPGLTGPWQVSARNGKLMHECTEMDLEYVDQIALKRDLQLLIRTPIAMFGNRQGY